MSLPICQLWCERQRRTWRRFRVGRNIPVGDNGGLGTDARLFRKVTIGRDVMMGPEVIIVAQNHAFAGAIIRAGVVVTKDVAAYTIVAGNPARAIRKRTDVSRDVRGHS